MLNCQTISILETTAAIGGLGAVILGVVIIARLLAHGAGERLEVKMTE